MVSSIVAEETWLHALDNVERWTPPPKHTVIIAPHPDDETLGAGGLIGLQRRQATTVSVICVTDGEAAYNDTPNLAETRMIEQRLALETLGVPSSDIHRLHLHDSSLAAHASALATLMEPFFQPDILVIAPWTLDWHPDHEACGRVAKELSQVHNCQLAFYLFWTWHQGSPESLPHNNLRRLELTPELQSLKQRALLHHQSQLQRASNDPILPQDLLKPAFRPFETFIVHE